MLLEVNLTMIIFAVSFLIFIFLLNLTLFKPVGNIVEKRGLQIEGSYSKAKELTDEANKILQNHEIKIKEARLNAKKIVEDIGNEAKNKKLGKITTVIESLTNEKETAIAKIREEQTVKEKELKSKISELKDLITTKILGTEENSLVGTH